MSAFHARILASDTLFFDGDCEFMVVPCTDGAMGILSHHSNMIAAVVPGELRFQPVGGPLRTAAVSAGLVKVEAGEVMLLVSTAERPEDIDVNRARRAEDAARRPYCKRKVCRSTGTRRPSWPGPSAVCGPKNTGTADAEL